MRIRPLPDVHCLNCHKVVADSKLKGYLKYFCDDCLQIDKKEEHELRQRVV